jgi:hypothetical protein
MRLSPVREKSEPAVKAEHPGGPRNKADATLAASRKLMLILSDAGVLEKEDLLPLTEQHPHEFLGDVLIREGVLVEDFLHGLLVRTLHIPWVVADCCTVPADVAALVPEGFCREHRVMPISRTREFLTLAVVNPLDPWVMASVGESTGLAVRPVLCSATQLSALIEATYRKPKEAESEAGREAPDEPPEEPAEPAVPNLTDVLQKVAQGIEQANEPEAKVLQRPSHGEEQDGVPDDSPANAACTPGSDP